MSLLSLLRILLARWWLILLVLVSCVLLTLAVSLNLPKQYTATTELILNGNVQDRMTGQFAPARSGYMATQVEVIRSRNVAGRVYAGLPEEAVELARQEALRDMGEEADPQRWVTSTLARNLVVTPGGRDSNVLSISVQGGNPELAAAMANTLAAAYMDTNLELRTDPARRFSDWYDQQMAVLRQKLRDAHRELSSYQQEHGIVALDERLDVETSRLQELSSMLVVAQGEHLQDQIRDNQSQRPAAAYVPDNVVIQNLRSQLTTAETRLEDLATRYGLNHPEYRKAVAEVNALRQSLQREMAIVTRSLRSTAEFSESQTGELEAQLEQQRARVLQLNAQRDELELLRQEVDMAQQAYNSAAGRASANQLESRLAETDVTVLNPAVVPVRPSAPDLRLNLVVSVALGLLLGVGLALLLEMTNRRVRSRADVEEILGLPVLGYLPFPQTEARYPGAH